MSTNNTRGGRKKSKSRMQNDGKKPSIRFYHCKKEGHTRRFCSERQKKANNLDKRLGLVNDLMHRLCLVKQL